MGLLAQLLVVIVWPRVAAIEFSGIILMITTVIVIVVVLLSALLLTALLVVAATIVITVTIRLHAGRDGHGLLSSVTGGGPLAPLVCVRGGAVFVVVSVFVALPVELQAVIVGAVAIVVVVVIV